MVDDGKRSLFSGGSGEDSGDGGKESLYSGTDATGPVKIDCARCGATSQVGLLDALKRLFRFSLWIPGRMYNRRLDCPACDQRSWVKMHLT